MAAKKLNQKVKLYDGSEVTVYPQGPGFVVWNIVGAVDEYPDLRRFMETGTYPLCTLLIGGGQNATGDFDINYYPQVQYYINVNGRVCAMCCESPTLIPCWSGVGSGVEDLTATDYGRWYWNENIFTGNGGTML